MVNSFPIFISYRHSDTADKAEHLLTLLEASGYKGRVSFDRENLDGRFDLEILRRLDLCTDFIVILGPHTLDKMSAEDVVWYQRLSTCSESEFPGIEEEMIGAGYRLDFVRLEIARAIAKGKHIIPIVPINTPEYSFDRLELPDDIQLLIKQHAEKYQDSKDFLFKEILPRVRKRLKTRPGIGKWLKYTLTGVLVVALVLSSVFYLRERRVKTITELKGSGYTAINDSNGTDHRDSIKVRWSDECSILQIRVIKDLINNMMLVPSGGFVMGIDNPVGAETPSHHVLIDDAFYIGKFEVSEREWSVVLNDIDEGDELLPKANVSWSDCRNFVRRLSELTGLVFTLPTPEQWEYSARWGEREDWIFAGGNKPESVAAFTENSGGKPQYRGKHGPNALELYDMSGNVAEWCSDGNNDAPKQIIRGGSYDDDREAVTVTYADFASTESCLPTVGMRLVLLK